MRILVTGACGFVGSTLARTWRERGAGHALYGIDNLTRPGSESNRALLKRLGVRLWHGDIRLASDFETLPAVDWVIDAAASPSVLAGIDGQTSSRQLVEHNLLGTVNLLEYCRRHSAGLILLSTSRVYSIRHLAALSVDIVGPAFRPVITGRIRGLSHGGVAEDFPTEAPISLYGATKLASETLALEYGVAFSFQVWVNRCGVLAGAGQFARQDQGIFSFWIHSWAQGRPLHYMGFDGLGHQVRDCLHPRDLIPLLEHQMGRSGADTPRVVNVSGGSQSATSLRECSDWCTQRFGPRSVVSTRATRPYDVPWLVLDVAVAHRSWGWIPETPREAIFEEIAAHACDHPEWLDLTHG